MPSNNVDMAGDWERLLGRFLSANFHQDWDADFDSEEAVIKAYRNAVGPVAVSELVRSIDIVLERNVPERELKRLLYDLGLCTEIGGDGEASRWLRDIRASLLDADP